MKHSNHFSGFTLMELPVVLAMIAILLGLAIPNPGAFLDDNRLRVGASDFITFRANGRTSVASTQVLILCDERGFGTDAKGLVISILGRCHDCARYRSIELPGAGVLICDGE